MKNENESRRFLEYSDDPARSGEIGTVTQTQEEAKNSICDDRATCNLVLFLAASLLWLAAAVLFLGPWPATISEASASNKHGGPTSAQNNAGDYRVHNIASDAQFATCGNSTAEARQNGCKYDPLLNN